MKKFILPGIIILSIGFIFLNFLYPQLIPIDRNAETNYQEYCASCHGENLKSFVDRKWLYGNSWNEIYAGIRDGYPDDGMVAYDTTFTDNEMAALTDYILRGIEGLTRDDFRDRPDWSGTIVSERMNFRIEEVVSGLGVPWGLAFLPNGDMLITEREGSLSLYSSGELQKISGVPTVRDQGQGGLLDVEVHPEFTENQMIYLSFSKPNGSDNTTAVMRAKLEMNQLTNPEIIFEATPSVSTRHHYGSRLEFDKEGYLYVSVGDRGRRSQHPQYLNNHCGKIHRLHDDGSIPDDNPFVDERGAKASIYSYGHRNPQGLAIDPETGVIWENEHGPRGGDEINIIEKGKNYGWPVISYGINYNGTKFTDLTEKEGMEQPQHYWVPAIGVCGLEVVTGDRYPAWKGDLLSGSLAFQYLSLINIENGKVVGEEILLKNIGRLRDVKMGNDGFIYFTCEDPGRVYRIIPLET